MKHKSRLQSLQQHQQRREDAFWHWALPRLDDAEFEQLRGLMAAYRRPCDVPVDRLRGDDLRLWLRLESLLLTYLQSGS